MNARQFMRGRLLVDRLQRAGIERDVGLGLPPSMRKASLSRLLARRVDGIFLSDFSRARLALTCSATLV